MKSEHWGTLSVKDHLDTQAIVADLLLYDRLVFPVMDGDGERGRWRKEGWEPDQQEALIERLGRDVAVTAPWGDAAQSRWKDLREARDQIAFDAYQLSRMVLAMDQDYQIPEGVKVRAIAAYHDDAHAKQALNLEKAQPDQIAVGKLAYVVGRELLVPTVDPDEASLDLVLRARDLSQTRSYRAERAEFYEWLEHTVDAIAKGRSSVDDAIDELRRRADALDHPVRTYFASHRKGLAVKTAFAVVGLALPHALGLPEVAGAVGAIPHIFELLKFTSEQVVDASDETRVEAAAVVASAGSLRRRPRLGLRMV